MQCRGAVNVDVQQMQQYHSTAVCSAKIATEITELDQFNADIELGISWAYLDCTEAGRQLGSTVAFP
jgi:hypothetical protein